MEAISVSHYKFLFFVQRDVPHNELFLYPAPFSPLSSFKADNADHSVCEVCKYYQGSEEKYFEKKLKKLFGAVHREKPNSSRKVSLSIHMPGESL